MIKIDEKLPVRNVLKRCSCMRTFLSVRCSSVGASTPFHLKMGWEHIQRALYDLWPSMAYLGILFGVEGFNKFS
jgi:hypothetical protein